MVRRNVTLSTTQHFPLIVFVHVPKTAGTTVRRVLLECSHRGRNYSRRRLLRKPEFLETARAADWISGHLRRDVFARALIWSERKVEYFATIREPIAQLASHLNFTFERSMRDDYRKTHSAKEINLDSDVMSTDFSDVSAVKDLLLAYKKHYLNVQSRLIIGKDYKVISEDEVTRRLASYTFVSTVSDLPKLYRAFGFARLPEKAETIRENTSQSHLSPATFEALELKKFLTRHLAHDFRLYDMVARMKWKGEARAPFRPAFLGAEIVTAANFDEAAYLDSNEDVAKGVADGLFTSGRHHFDTFGHREQRCMRRTVLPAPGSPRQSIPNRSLESSEGVSTG
jgi:hypothetical protein